MIYLKTFEGFKFLNKNSKKDYRKITEEEYFEMCPHKNTKFTGKEIDEITSVNGINYINDDFNTIEINGYEITKIEGNHFIVSFTNNNNSIYYKCDKIEGLIKCINDLK
jgi:hypothetical protein